MKYKITRRLILYFSIVLLLFSVIVGSLFSVLFTRHTAKVQEQSLRERAVSIANTLSQFQIRDEVQCQYGHGMSEHNMGAGMGSAYGTYLQFIDNIAMCEVWLVDEKAQTIQMVQGHHDMEVSLSYEELPDGAEELIQEVFAGNVEANQAFSSLLEIPCVTVGAPVLNGDGKIAAALLLHSPIDGLDQAQKDGVVILVFCIFAAFLLAVGLSTLLVRRFIRPLKKMKATTERIMEGDYSVRTEVVQDDEIGALAQNIDELSIKLLEVNQERKDFDKMRQDFVSNISHELRTPVTVLRGSLEVLVEGLITEPEEMKQYFQQMLADTIYLQRLVNDLLELSRLQNTNFHIEKSELNLTDVLLEVIRSMQRVSEQKQVEITFRNEIGAFPFWGDYGRLRQMFITILDNAVKFSNVEERVEVTMRGNEDRCEVLILDYGKGIPNEELPHIFDRFYHERSEQNKSGSGLGLSIAKQIADRHEIEIQCKSELGKGTCFHFIFKGSSVLL